VRTSEPYRHFWKFRAGYARFSDISSRLAVFGYSFAPQSSPLYRFVVMDFPKLWALIEADLERTRSTLPDDASSHKAIRDYREFLNHNERELACDMLEVYAVEQEVTREFRLALHDAAIKMHLPKANR
jgi:hypothetical protein